MKTSRFVALATATAVAFSAVTPAQAAQIGPPNQNKCKVTFTAAEKDFLTSMEQDVASRLDVCTRHQPVARSRIPERPPRW